RSGKANDNAFFHDLSLPFHRFQSSFPASTRSFYHARRFCGKRGSPRPKRASARALKNPSRQMNLTENFIDIFDVIWFNFV
mgnify:CR=1